ncbi:MAG: DUF6064 family protein [Hyphomicrobiales bacterium]|nr:DUF6064 family protein [Hyphomicrobiales bacterium]
MSLPYTVEVFFASMAEYNRLWFPEALLAVVLMPVAFALAVRPLPGRAGVSARLAGALLAAAWVWVGWAHQLQHMAILNFMAPVYGSAWIVQGGLIALTCAVLGRVRFRFGGGVRGWTGLALALFGLIGYPIVVLLLGYGWRSVPLAGMAPDPTAIFTAGFLAAARERPPLHLFVLPLGWAGVAAVSAYLLGFPLDYAVAAAVLAAAALATHSHMRDTIG